MQRHQSLKKLETESEISDNEDCFICLCDPHHSVIQEYNSYPECKEVAAGCLKGCSRDQNSHFHSKRYFIQAKRFHKMFLQIRAALALESHQSQVQNIPEKNREEKKTLPREESGITLEKQVSGAKSLLSRLTESVPISKPIENILTLREISEVDLSSLQCRDVSTIERLHVLFEQEKAVPKDEREERIVNTRTNS